MKKLLILLICIVVMVGCSKKETIDNNVDDEDVVENVGVSTKSDIVVTEKEESVIKREYNVHGCEKNEEGFYYCWRDDEDQDGDVIVYYNGYPVEKKVFDNGFVLYYDDEHPELGYTAIHKWGGFAEMYNDYTVTTYYTDDYDSYTVFFDRQTGDVFKMLEGECVFLENDGVISNTWFAVLDGDEFKLMSGDSLEWYEEYCLFLHQAPALQYSYQLGNGTYFEAYKYIDGDRVNYILDMNGNVLLEDSDSGLSVGKNTNYIVRSESGKVGLVLLDGNLVLPLEYDAVEAYENGIVATKDNRLYVYSNTLTPLINGEYELADREYSSYLCCDNYNNFTAYDSSDGLVVITIDTDYMYGRSDDETIEINPNYTHKFLVKGEKVTELEYDFRY